VSHETIYLAIYTYPRGELKRQLISYLRQGKGKRRPRTMSATRRELYPAELSIHLRPPEVEDRLVPGHWESDLIIGTNNRSAVATMVECTSRYAILAKLDAPTADAAAQAITREMSRMAPSLLKP
jgi:IS30 family transposase